MEIEVNSFFNGGGLLDIGLMQGGLTIQQAFEIDQRACETQRMNFDHEINQCDITEKTALDDNIPNYVYNRLHGRGGYRDAPIISDPESGDIAPTCVAHYSKDISTRLVADSRFPDGVRPYTPREYARLQGVPDWFQFAGTDRQSYKIIGNGVPVPVGRWIGREIKRYFKTY